MKLDGIEKTAARSATPGEDPKTGGWTVVCAGELQVLHARALAEFPWLVHGFSTRVGGASRLNGRAALNLGFTEWDTRRNVLTNRAKLLAALSAEQMHLVSLRQIHSDIIHVLEAPPKHPPRGDAAITRAPGLLLAVQAADCVPILLADTARRAVAAVHAG